MAYVVVRGTRYGEQLTARWQDGTVTGDSLLLEMLAAAEEERMPAQLTPTGPWYDAGTADPHQFLATATTLLYDVSVEAVDLPPLPVPEPGAVS